MTNNRWDGTLNGVKFRLVRGSGAYNRFFSRQQVEEQFVLPTGGRTSRADRRKFMQTNWAGGSAWFRPLIGESTQDVYQYSTGLDVWSYPGLVRGLNARTANTSTTRGMDSSRFTVAPLGGNVTIAGVSSNNDGSGHSYGRYWHVVNDAWTDTTATFGHSISTTYDMLYNPEDERLYVLHSDGISWMDDGGTVAGSGITGSALPQFGSALALGPQGGLHYWDGNILRRIDDAGTAWETVTDDGLGPDVISYMLNLTPRTIAHYNRKLATGTSEGIYYVKNTFHSSGQPQAWVFRVERDAAGNIISVPIATLPVGNLVLSIGYAYGTPILVSTTQWSTALDNDGTNYHTDVWSIFGGTLGVLGRIYVRDPDDWTAETPTETVASFLGTWGELILFGGTTGAWAYDPVRGGIHHLFTAQSTANEEIISFAPWPTEDKVLFSDYEMDDVVGTYDLPTSTLGTDDDSMTLYSAWFDFDLPGEEKTITKVKTKSDETGISANNQWRVYIISEDGTSTDISHAHTNVQEKETTGLSITSERFRYRLIYETNLATAQPQALSSIFITAEAGEVVQGWQLVVDGTEFENVENEKQDPEEVYDNWVTLGQNQTAITFEDNFEAFDRPDKTSHTVRVQNVSIQKEAPGEARIEVVLIDAT